MDAPVRLQSNAPAMTNATVACGAHALVQGNAPAMTNASVLQLRTLSLEAADSHHAYVLAWTTHIYTYSSLLSCKATLPALSKPTYLSYESEAFNCMRICVAEPRRNSPASMRLHASVIT
jgi:hypothetical protein